MTTAPIMQLWKEYGSTVLGWAVAIAVLVAFELVSRATSYHRLAIGLLVSAIVLAVALIIVEGLWRAAEALVGQVDGPNA